MVSITETHEEVFNVTMVTVYVAEKNEYIYIYWWTYDSEVNLALMWLRLKNYIELMVRLHTASEVWYLYDCLVYKCIVVTSPLGNQKTFSEPDIFISEPWEGPEHLTIREKFIFPCTESDDLQCMLHKYKRLWFILWNDYGV